MVADRRVTPQELGTRLQAILSAYPVRLLFSTKTSRLHILLEYPPEIDWDREAVWELLAETITQAHPQGIQQVLVYGRLVGQKTPEWQRSIDFPATPATPPPQTQMMSVGIPSSSSMGLGTPATSMGAAPEISASGPSSGQTGQIILGGRYQVLKVLGSGGFGRTFLAQDQQRPGHPTCVVKQLRPKFADPKFLENARRLFNVEAETLEQLGQHDQIPRLLAYFEQDKEFFLVQEFIQGRSLSQDLSEDVFSEEQVIGLLHDLLQVLRFIHEHNVIHRDIKPENIIRRAEDGKYVLIDFGAGKQLQTGESTQASHTMAVGTLGYIPAEQYAGAPQFNSDIYALGMVAVQCLTGLAPTQLSTDPRGGEIQWRDHCRASEKLAEILTGMIRVQFQQRFQSAQEALLQLERSFHLSPAAGPNWGGLAQAAFARLRQPQVLAALVLGTVGFGTVIFGATWATYASGARAAKEEYYEGVRFAQRQDWSLAGNSYREALDLNPLYPAARAGLARSQKRLDELQEEIDTQREILLQQPNNPKARLALGIALYRHGQVEDALEQLTTATAFDANDAQIHYHLGRAYAQQESWDQAIASYRRALELQSTLVDARIDLGLALLANGATAEAADSFRVATELSRNHPNAYYYLGQAQARQENWNAALENYLIALNLDSKLRQMRNDLGFGLYAPDQIDQAIEAYERTLRQDPTQAMAHLHLGDAFYASGDLNRAQQAYEEAFTKDPALTVAHIKLGRILAEQQQWDRSLSAYEAALALEPANPQALTGRGTVIAQRAIAEDQPLDEAVRLLQQAVQSNPADAEAQLQLGLALAQQEQTEPALQSFNRAVQLNPANAEARRVLGDALVDQGNTDAAIQQFDSALDANPADPATYISMAGAQAEQEDVGNALINFKTAAVLEQTGGAEQPESGVSLTQAYTSDTEIRHANRLRRAVLPPEQRDTVAALTPEQVGDDDLADAVLEQLQQENLINPNQVTSLAGETDGLLTLDLATQLLFRSLLFTVSAVVILLFLGSLGLGSYVVLESYGLVRKPMTKEERERERAYTLLRKGLDHYQAGKWDEAMAAFTAALRIREDYPDALFYIGQTWVKRGDYGQAMQLFWKLHGINPEFEGLQGAMVKTLLTAGNMYMRQEEYDQAFAKFQAALNLYAEGERVDPDIYYHMGLALSKQRDDESWDRAIDYLEKALDLNPNLAPAHATLGTVYSLRLQFAAAIAAFEAGLRLDPRLVEAHHEIGKALYKLGDLHRSIQHLYNVIRLSPHVAKARTDLGFALLQAGDLESARQEFTAALSKDPHLSAAHLGLGTLLCMSGEFEEARERCNQALQMDPGNPSALAMLGLIHLEAQVQATGGSSVVKHRTLEIAHAKFETAIKADIHVPEAHYGLGEISRLKREYAFAVESFTNALMSNGSYTAAHYRLGMVYYALENYDKAIQQFQKTLDLDTNHLDARAYLERTQMQMRGLRS
ncbi:MAG: tetratricopeptide repeat protein [Synechococcaceae cyanobacterium SM2_3_1]|nr:tetratricopeptide repeat protein [Synechococcaceae cyanobacterium SM2_3_1]